jgi:hypothetical protein
MSEIKRGVMFDTEFEQRCIALAAPDEFGAFDGVDSENVICSFSKVMVTYIHNYARAAARACYRVGAVDVILGAVRNGEMEMPGIFVQQMEGELSFRTLELHGTGVSLDDLEDMRVKSAKEKKKAQK